MKILDLGCGTAKVKGAIGLDNASLPGVDVVHDLLDFPYPFEDRSFDTIYLRHVIEHFELKDIERIFAECARILHNNGHLEVKVPHVYSVAAFTDPTHKRFFTFSSGRFWDRDHDKAYYEETSASWVLVNTSCRITWYNWKRYRLRKFDRFLSSVIERRIKKALDRTNNPSLADRIVKKASFQFVEIAWTFQKQN